MYKTPVTIGRTSQLYPAVLAERLGADAPRYLQAMGDPALLRRSAVALFCSARCPGDAVLRTHDLAVHWREAGQCVISGFHSPIEKECLRILLRGKPPIIICPARSIENFRVPAEWRAPMDAGRLLILSRFPAGNPRATAKLAAQRNLVVAALADEHWFAHITPGGQMDRLSKIIRSWPALEP